MKNISVFILFLSIFFTLSCTQNTELGSKKNPIVFALIPGKDVKILEFNGKKLEEWLNKNTPYHFSIFVPNSYVAVIESLGSKKTDMAVLNTFGYVLGHSRYQVEPLFTMTTQGKGIYRGQIIAHKDGIKNIQELNKKKFAFVDPLSASGYLMALHFLKKHKIDLGEHVFAGRHDIVVTMVYNKRVDAGATFFLDDDENGTHQDARQLVIKQFPDVYDKVKTIGFTDYLPSEAIVIRKDFPPEMRKIIQDKMLYWSQTPEGKITMKGLYASDGLKLANDRDYDPARKLLEFIDKKME